VRLGRRARRRGINPLDQHVTPRCEEPATGITVIYACAARPTPSEGGEQRRAFVTFPPKPARDAPRLLAPGATVALQGKNGSGPQRSEGYGCLKRHGRAHVIRNVATTGYFVEEPASRPPIAASRPHPCPGALVEHPAPSGRVLDPPRALRSRIALRGTAPCPDCNDDVDDGPPRTSGVIACVEAASEGLIKTAGKHLIFRQTRQRLLPAERRRDRQACLSQPVLIVPHVSRSPCITKHRPWQ
jgi:hypothetical protein